MFWFRKVLVFWTWNHHVLSMYWLSIGGFVPSVKDLTGSEADDEETSGGEVVSSPSGSSSSGSGSSGSSLYDDGRTTFLPVIIHDIDGDPDENSEPIPVWEPPVLAMLLGPSVMTTLVPIKEDMDVLMDLQFIPPSL